MQQHIWQGQILCKIFGKQIKGIDFEMSEYTLLLLLPQILTISLLSLSRTQTRMEKHFKIKKKDINGNKMHQMKVWITLPCRDWS